MRPVVEFVWVFDDRPTQCGQLWQCGATLTADFVVVRVFLVSDYCCSGFKYSREERRLWKFQMLVKLLIKTIEPIRQLIKCLYLNTKLGYRRRRANKKVIKQSLYNKFNKCLQPRVVARILFHFKHILVRAAAEKTCWMHFAMDFWHQAPFQICGLSKINHCF